jgi:hypothetical protein
MCSMPPSLLWSQHDALILLALDHLQGLHEMLPAGLDRGRILLVARQVGMYELNEAVEVLGCDLRSGEEGQISTHCERTVRE